jgi:peptide/nickel transport system substrate-binding protein
MRLKKPIVAISAVGLLALAACGGSDDGGGTTPSSGPGTGPASTGESGQFQTTEVIGGKDPTAVGPAAEIEGAVKGGTLTVLKADTITTLDPTESYYTDSASILSGLITRSLTQYKWDPTSEEMILVPDLATDLGRPNKTFTKWTFTLKDGIKWENGKPVTPADIAFGIERSFDRTTFPGGAGYSNDYFKNGDTFKGPYTDKGGSCQCVTISGMDITIAMAQPFPDMPYWGAFPAMGPIPSGSASDPAKYKLHPLSTGPYMFKPGSFTVGKKLTLIPNPNWDAATDPARHQYIDEIDFNFDADSAQTDQILLQDTGEGQTTITYNNVLSADYGTFVSQAPDRLVKGPNPCTFMQYPDNRKITDISVRRAIGLAYPYRDAWAAGGSIAGVTRIPASNIMPPGIPGRTEYNPRPGVEPGQTDAAKAKALLQKSGNLNYKLVYAYLSDDPNSVAVKNVVTKAYKDAGFNPQPFASTGANYATQVLQNPDWVGNVRGVGWCSDWPSGGSWFPPVFHGTDVDKTGVFGSNYAAFDKADAEIDAIQKLPIEQQPDAWNKLDKEIQDKWYPVVVTGYGADAMARGSKVMNMTNDPVFGMPNWKDMWLQS